MRNQYKILSEKYTEVQLNEYFAEDSVTPEEDKKIFYAIVEMYKKALPPLSKKDIKDFYNWFNTEKRIEYGFGPLMDVNESSWGIFQQITYVRGEDELGWSMEKIGKKFDTIAPDTLSMWYNEYAAKGELHKDNPGVNIDI